MPYSRIGITGMVTRTRAAIKTTTSLRLGRLLVGTLTVGVLLVKDQCLNRWTNKYMFAQVKVGGLRSQYGIHE